jgi:S1-C subfamily serine protease
MSELIEQHPTRYRGLLIIAILAGMATAAGVVVLQAFRSAKEPIRLSTDETKTYQKPSAFGTVNASSAPPDVKLTPDQIVKAGHPAIVSVTGYDADDKPVAQGVGYIYSASGVIVTSYGAIRGASSVTVDTASGQELNVIALMGYSVSRDIAVLAVLEGNLPALETGAGEVVQEGDPVVVLGANGAVADGVVGPRKAIGGVDMMEISGEAPEGAPVLSIHGKVIGLATRRASGSRGVTLAIPSHYISDQLAEQHVTSFAQMLEETQGIPATTPPDPALKRD